MADPQTPATPPQTAAPPPAQKPAAADPHIAPLTPEELSRFSGGGGGFTASTPINDGSVAPLTPDELKMFGGFTPPPLTGPPGSGHRPVPHPWADLFSAVTTGLGIAGGMMAAPELASATGLGAASDAIASGGANFMGRTVLPFLTRLAWRVPAAAGGAWRWGTRAGRPPLSRQEGRLPRSAGPVTPPRVARQGNWRPVASPRGLGWGTQCLGGRA